MTQSWRRIAVAVALVLATASGARAADGDLDNGLTERHQPNPGTALGAAALNVVYVPVRLVVTLGGGFLGGLTGFLTGGDEHAASDVHGLVDGSQVITPKMLEGREQFRFSRYD
ncbi:MAG: hypothetical protein AB7V27_07365 [Candidatus Binatia bacterium]